MVSELRPCGTVMENLPLASVCVARAVPVIVTVAPEAGCLLDPVTVPVTTLCANEVKEVSIIIMANLHLR